MFNFIMIVLIWVISKDRWIAKWKVNHSSSPNGTSFRKILDDEIAGVPEWKIEQRTANGYYDKYRWEDENGNKKY